MKGVFFVAILSLVAMGARAEQITGSRDNPTELPDSILVTANRTGLVRSQEIWPAEVISSRSLNTQTTLGEVLDGRGGLDVRNFSGFGSLSTLSNWGTFNRHMLLLYDGRMVRDYSLGGFNLSDYSPAEFERVELLKGPQSAFFGSDAIGGVVNLISRSTTADRVRFSSSAGNQGYRQYRLDLSRKLRDFGVGGFAEYSEADNNRDNAGVKRLILGFRSDYLSADGRHRARISGRYFEDSLGVPGPVPDSKAIPSLGNGDASSLYDHQLDDNYSLDAHYTFSSSQTDEFKLGLFWENKNLDYYSKFDFGGITTSRSRWDKRSSGITGSWQRKEAPVEISTGIDWLYGKVKSANESDSPFGTTYAFWAASQHQFDTWGDVTLESLRDLPLRLDLSARLQFVKGRQTQPSYNVGVRYLLSDSWSVKFGYGYAYRLPSLADQFAQDAYTVGNIDLSAETSRSFVATTDISLGSNLVDVRLSLFRQQVDSLIQYVFNPITFLSSPINIDKFRSTGVDLSLTYTISSTASVSVGGIWQDAEQTGDGGGYRQANYVPDVKARVDWDHAPTNWLRYNLNATYTDDRHIVLFNGSPKSITNALEIGGSVQTRIYRWVTLSMLGEDLTNQKRPDQFGFTATDGDYPTPGRRFRLTATVNVL